MNLPKRRRIDSEAAALLVRDIVRAAGLNAAMEHDAAFDGDVTTTVVQARSARPTGSLPSNMWLYRAEVTLMTFARRTDDALTANRRAGDALIDTDRFEDVRLSSTTCISEPVTTGRQSPTGAATVVSTYTTYLRSEV